jgi:hypothetical protein
MWPGHETTHERPYEEAGRDADIYPNASDRARERSLSRRVVLAGSAAAGVTATAR